MVLEMLFFIFNNANIQFADKKFIWKIYTSKEILSITRQIKLIDKKKFAKTVLDKSIEAFAVHMALLTSKIIIYPARKA